MHATVKKLFVTMYFDLIADGVGNTPLARYLDIIREAYPEEAGVLEAQVVTTRDEGGDFAKLLEQNKVERVWAATRTVEDLLETLLTIYGLIQQGKLEKRFLLIAR